MGHKFAEIAFTPVVRSLQVADGRRAGYARMAEGEDYNHRLTAREGTVIAARDSFYMASVSAVSYTHLRAHETS